MGTETFFDEKLANFKAVDQKPKERKERKEKKKERAIGETLETAFDVKENQEPFVDEKTAKDIKLYDIAHILVFGDDRYHDSEYLEDSERREVLLKSGDTRQLDKILQYAPNNAKMIRLRQEMLSELVGGDKNDEEKEKYKDFIRKVREMTDELSDILGVHVNYTFEKTGQKKLNGVEYNIEELREYINGNIEKSLDMFEKEIFEISGNSEFILELRTSVDRAKIFAKKFKDDIEKGGWISRLEKQNELIKISEKEEFPKNYPRPFISPTEYRDFLKEIYAEKEEGFQNFLNVLRNLDKFLMCAQVIDKRGLSKIEIFEKSGLEFKEAKSPFLMADLHIKKVVPFDLNVTKEQPITIVTGDNATGKSKLVDAVVANSAMAQSIGYAMAKGGRYSPKKEVAYLHSLNVKVDETQWSRGQKEMKALAEIVGNLKENNLIVMDEFLTSTDSVGAISIVLAVLEQNAEKGGVSFLTIHSRDLEKIKDRNLVPMVRFLRAKEGAEGEKTYQWEEGIGRANPLALAKASGLPEAIIKRAEEIQNELEKNK